MIGKVDAFLVDLTPVPAPKPIPPTSTTWLRRRKQCDRAARREMFGVTTVKSCRCPVPSHGSLVTKTSPSTMLSSGKRARKCPTLAAMALTWPGVPVTAWASNAAFRVENTPAREVAGFAHRGREGGSDQGVWACSSTTERSRFHMILKDGYWLSAVSPAADDALHARSSWLVRRFA